MKPIPVILIISVLVALAVIITVGTDSLDKSSMAHLNKAPTPDPSLVREAYNQLELKDLTEAQRQAKIDTLQRTKHLKLYKPMTGEMDWGANMNANLDKIDARIADLNGELCEIQRRAEEPKP